VQLNIGSLLWNNNATCIFKRCHHICTSELIFPGYSDFSEFASVMLICTTLSFLSSFNFCCFDVMYMVSLYLRDLFLTSPSAIVRGKKDLKFHPFSTTINYRSEYIVLGDFKCQMQVVVLVPYSLYKFVVQFSMTNLKPPVCSLISRNHFYRSKHRSLLL
jgi:hypothetical protein